MNRRVTVTCKVKPIKRSRSESESEQGDKYVGVDPKPSDLVMIRLKSR